MVRAGKKEVFTGPCWAAIVAALEYSGCCVPITIGTQISLVEVLAVKRELRELVLRDTAGRLIDATVSDISQSVDKIEWHLITRALPAPELVGLYGQFHSPVCSGGFGDNRARTWLYLPVMNGAETHYLQVSGQAPGWAEDVFALQDAYGNKHQARVRATYREGSTFTFA